MSTLNDARKPSLKDKLAAKEAALKKEVIAVESEIQAVEVAKKRAGKKKN